MLTPADVDAWQTAYASSFVREGMQTNHYFDTQGFGYLRIREKKGEYTITIKLPSSVSVHTMEEHSAHIDLAVATQYIRQGISAEDILRLTGISIPTAHAGYLGQLCTHRAVYTVQGLTFELDTSTYLGITDYEMECEVTNAHDWQKAEGMIRKACLHAQPSPLGKLPRFAEKLRRLQH